LQHKVDNIKSLLRVAAVFAFGCCFVAGLLIFGLAVSTGHSDSPVIAALALVLIGFAFFAGGMLLVAAEKVAPKIGWG
jgi:hypothetical protein